MARVTLNPALSSFRGELGDLVFKKRFGRTYAVPRTDMRARQPSEAQKATWQRFRRAATYAKTVMADPEERNAYEIAAKAREWSVQNVIVADFLNPPSVDHIDARGYHGNPGDSIRVTASDDFDVTAVTVTISDSGGQPIEQGRAMLSSMNCGRWVYTATVSIPAGTNVRVEAVATDRPGNTAAKSEQKEV